MDCIYVYYMVEMVQDHINGHPLSTEGYLIKICHPCGTELGT